MKAWYRLWQFGMALQSLWRPADSSPAAALLSPAEQAVFQRMAPYDQAHALRVLRHLQAGGTGESALLQAALLHDLAKSAGQERIPLLYRGAIVLARSRPWLWAWLARERPAGHPLRPFFLYTTHAARSAVLAREAGCTEEVAALIAAHHDAAAAGPAALLREADRAS